MNVLKVLFVMAAVCFSAAWAFNCSAPIFAEANSNFNAVVYELTDPTPVNDVCPRLSGEQSCCNQRWFDAVTTEWNEFMENYARAQVRASEATLKVQRLLQIVIDAAKRGVEENESLSEDTKTAVIAAFNGYNDALQKFLSGFVDALVKCINVVLRYILGVFCLSCRPDWALYISESSGLQYLLATEVCDDLKEGCGDYLSLVETLITELNATQYQLHEAIGSGAYNKNYLRPCRNAPVPGDCQSYACYRIARGLNTDVDDVQDTVDDSSDRFVEAIALLGDRLGREIEGLGELREAFVHHSTAARVLARHRAEAQEVAGRRASSSNEYSASGFNVVAEGESSNLEKDVSPAASFSCGLAALF